MWGTFGCGQIYAGFLLSSLVSTKQHAPRVCFQRTNHLFELVSSFLRCLLILYIRLRRVVGLVVVELSSKQTVMGTRIRGVRLDLQSFYDFCMLFFIVGSMIAVHVSVFAEK